ncbi:MAG: hypothetical protein HYY65_10870 [Candidatus Tectomicrobia bacterium]|uniref:Uncharacterized protein n=1 Tax=Tectimicrobiota bacterium TaxID=2528274 RepID=A0A932GQZ4_UNCTE|nr:hypothetical protein [Candidatus Tectomicrobia bacterium]
MKCVPVLLVLLTLFAVPAWAADPPPEVCEEFRRALPIYKHIQNETRPATFEFDGKPYRGCEVVFKTRWSLIGANVQPAPQTLLSASESGEMYRKGWRADLRYDADGRGSTSYVIRREDMFCRVLWEFVAYVDEKTKEVVSGDDLSGEVQCSLSASSPAMRPK